MSERYMELANNPHFIEAIAKELSCLPSYFVDGNDHIVDAVKKLKADKAKLQAEMNKLKELARLVIRTECWGYDNIDGCELQDMAERLGLITPKIATKEDVSDDSDYDIGDKIYVFSESLKESEEKEQ